MPRISKGTGWSNEANLLYEILKSLDRIENLLRVTTTTTTTIVGNTVTVSGLSSPYRVISDRDPLATDDISYGHTVTTQWLNTVSKDLFECLNNTLGAAVWHKIQYIYL